MKYPIVEIFSSIQGEGLNLGKPANFIRLAGCNLKCPWCDTKWDLPTLGFLTVSEIIDKIDLNTPLTVITGGEPLMHPIGSLIDALTFLGQQIAIETNGTYATMQLKVKYPNLFIACSPKPQTDWSIHTFCEYDELKYIVDGALKLKHIASTKKPIWLQPEGSNMNERWAEALKLQRQALKERRQEDIRIGIQLHKIMEVR